MVRARFISGIEDNVEDGWYSDQDNIDQPAEGKSTPVVAHSDMAAAHSIARRVEVRQSPYINTFYHHHPLRITIDSGAETNMIRECVAKYIGAIITKSSQIALQADGQSPLQVVGETRLSLTRDQNVFVLEALVVKNLDVDILGGVPFMDTNDVAVRPRKRHVVLSDGSVYEYGSFNKAPDSHAIRRTKAYVLRAPSSITTVWPGEYIEIDLPSELCSDSSLALEPRIDSPASYTLQTKQVWPCPDIITSVGNKIRIPNTTDEPKILRRNEHFCQVHHVFVPPTSKASSDAPTYVAQPPAAQHSKLHSDTVQLDPDNLLLPSIKGEFQSLLADYDDVFDPAFKGYNGAVGHYEAVVNMGPVLPPQRKGRVPQYSRDRLVELQQKFDDLEAIGVFRRPEDVGIVAEYLNPSFLIKKNSGGFRLVTAFADVGRYSKPQPSLMPDVDSTLRLIGRWKYIIVTDLTSAFYQIPLNKESMKYCGVVTPFRGVRVYTRSAMGMPGSETALEELMCRILGDLLQEGVVAKLADDLYCGGDSPEDLLGNWKKVLQALAKCNMRLSAAKTVINPKTTTILGWIWSEGTIHASPHRIATLSTCAPPDTVRGLRSFVGAYKVLARVLPGCASILSPLDDAMAGRQSQDKLAWTDELRAAFSRAQESLASNKTIILPKPEDQMWIVTDGSVKQRGIGATLYITRDDKPRIAGFFSAKLRKHQVTWLPCEIEALSIATAVKHFSPYLIQSQHKACVLTDSKPCVQAFDKLCRGEFSASPRVSTFLSIVSRYQASIHHLAGSANVPSDFASRNAPDCDNPNCQVCSFIVRTEECVVRSVTIQDFITGNTKLPFTSRGAWLATQSECNDLRRTHAHLVQGTRPSKKLTNVKDVKRYLNVATISKDGLLVVKREEPLAPTRECIIVPRQVLDGLLTALHLRLDHPTSHQLKILARRYFYALNMDSAIDHVTKACHLCTSLQKVTHTLIKQSTGDPPDAVGCTFAADVLKRERQLILVLRETVTSYTTACIIDNEQSVSLRSALIQLCIDLRPLDGPHAVIRTDAAPGFVGLTSDDLLHHHRISIEVGRIKNPNKNPVAERAIQELEDELLRQEPTGGPVTPLTLTTVIARINSRIRGRGLSSREMWSQRDQFTNAQLPISDRQLIMEQHQQREHNHPHSEKAKAPHGKTTAGIGQIQEVGDLVYLHADRNKSCARDRYLVVSVEDKWCSLRKFTGAQLRSTSYKVRMSDCYKVYTPSQKPVYPRSRDNESSEDEDGGPQRVQPAPAVPDIPLELSLPAIDCERPRDYLDAGDNAVNDSSEDENSNPQSVPPRRSGRTRRPPKHLEDYIQ
jgi:hypothetical protein